MRYFFIKTAEGNRIPRNVNKNHVIDIRTLTREGINRLPLWNAVEMDYPEEGFFPDILCDPCIMVSRCFMETVLMYHPDIPYKGIKLWDREEGVNATYFLPVLRELDCLSEKSKANSTWNRLTRPIIEKDKAGCLAVFAIRNYGEKGIAGRLDFVESLLRRKIQGINLDEIEME